MVVIISNLKTYKQTVEIETARNSPKRGTARLNKV